MITLLLIGAIFFCYYLETRGHVVVPPPLVLTLCAGVVIGFLKYCWIIGEWGKTHGEAIRTAIIWLWRVW